MKKLSKQLVIVTAALSFGVSIPAAVILSAPQTVTAAVLPAGKLVLQYGKTMIPLKDATGQVYPIGTHVVRATRNTEQATGSYYLYINASKTSVVSFGEVIENYVMPNYTQTIDIGQGNYELRTSPLLGDAGKAGKLQPNGPVTFNVMFRLYNPNSGEHFYTADLGEKNNLVTVGWKYEGIGWKAPKSGEPVYRMYNQNAGDHHYTKSAGERDSLKKAGWKYEGIGWSSDTKQSVPIYRAYNPNAKAGSHNYTPNKGEQDNLIKVGWKNENIGWYGVK